MGIGKPKQGAKDTVDAKEKIFRQRVKDSLGMLIGTGTKGGTAGTTGMLCLEIFYFEFCM